MSDEYQRRIEQLERELEQSKAREEQERREKEQERREKEQERREKEQEKRKKEQAEAREEELKRQIQQTTLEEYLRDCHLLLFKALRIADKSVCSTGTATKVDGKYYPLWLRRWEGFTNIQQEHFDKIAKTCGKDRLFHESIAIRAMNTLACPDPAAYEKDVENFEKVAIEAPVRNIFRRLKEDPGMRKEFSFADISFSINHRKFKHKSEIGQVNLGADLGDEDPSDEIRETPRRTGPNKRLATERKIDTSTYPDGRGIRIYPGGENIVFVYDYKAVHKFPVKNIKAALTNEKLFMKVTDQVSSNKVPTDKKLHERDIADKQVAMVLTQVFDYMVTHGVAYGYIASGCSLVFLHTRSEDLRTLYYHLCIPDEEVNGENKIVDVFQTAVAQLASFCLLTLRSEAPSASLIDQATKKAKLKTWGLAYDESEIFLGTNVDSSQSTLPSQGTTGSLYEDKSTEAPPAARKISLRSRSTCKDTPAVRQGDDKDDDDDDDDDKEQDSNLFRASRVPTTTNARKRKEGPSSSASEDNRNTSSDSFSSPTREYCTQACLLGLKRGCDLDQSCPNVSSHSTVESGTKHPINATKLASLVGDRLRQNPYRDCAAVDPFDLKGKIGAIGALFKLELAQYGYTFVGKGTQSCHHSHLYHESLVYSRLEKLQGEVVPVYLGVIDLTRGYGGYLLPGGARVVHMMLMSWGGEVAADADALNMTKEKDRSSQAVFAEGVFHDDLRPPNLLWNEERRRVMVIDFDRATLRPIPKHKQVWKLSGKKATKNGTPKLMQRID